MKTQTLTAGGPYKGEVVRPGLQIGSVMKSLYIILMLKLYNLGAWLCKL